MLAPKRLTSLTADLPASARNPTVSPALAPPHVGKIRAAKACLTAIVRVSHESGLPFSLLMAIGQVESGRRDKVSRRILPWPWTINAAGGGHFYATKQAAVAAVHRLRGKGVAPIDVGCMQIDLHHHPHAFASLNEAFDPVANVRYGAAFLKRLHKAAGVWPLAIADYHSQTPSIGAAYAVRVLTAWRHERHGSAAAQLAALAADGVSGTATHSAPQQQVAGATQSTPAPVSPQSPTTMAVLRPPSPGISGRTGRTLADYRRAPVMIAGR